MIKLYESGVCLTDGRIRPAPADENHGFRGTMAYQILQKHNISGREDRLRIKMDALASPDNNYVNILETAMASGVREFPVPYVLTCCHNTLRAIGGTINEGDHQFGLSAVKKFGGIFVPAHMAVIHQYMREKYAGCGRMILGSDSHTRYGALGTMGIGEGGGEIIKQLLGGTYDIDYPEVIAVYLEGEPAPYVGPQDIALAVIGAVFQKGYVRNKVLEFVGPGIARLSQDYRNGIDTMSTETGALSSIWETDEVTEEYYEIHHRPGDFHELHPAENAWYDGCVRVNLDEIRPMAALPFHPSHVFSIDDLNRNLRDILAETEEESDRIAAGRAHLSFMDKIIGGKLLVQQGTIAGCCGGSFSNITAAARILKGENLGNAGFTMSVYPASQPLFLELMRSGTLTDLVNAGVEVRSAFCGPCFGAGDIPANNTLSVRHVTRNFANREGSVPAAGQMSAAILMDARSIAATAARGGVLTSAEEYGDRIGKTPVYQYDDRCYGRVYNGFGKAKKETVLVTGPNIREWPAFPSLGENLLLEVASCLPDPVTTTDELIPSGEASSYRSNPQKLAEFTLSSRDPGYVGRAKKIAAERENVLRAALPRIHGIAGLEDTAADRIQVMSAIAARKPGEGSAREQAASCQRVLGGAADIALDYATKRYRSNLINWGMLPLVPEDPGDFEKFRTGSLIYLPDIRKIVKSGDFAHIRGYLLTESGAEEVFFRMLPMTETEREIILDGCLINYNRKKLHSAE